MISKNTITVHPAQLTYPLTQRTLLPDFRDVFPTGFGAKEPYSYPQGSIAINAAASRARARAAKTAAQSTPQTGASGGGVVQPTGQVTNTASGGGSDFLQSLLGGINIGGTRVSTVVLLGGFVFVVVILYYATKGKGGGGGGRKHRRRHRRK